MKVSETHTYLTAQQKYFHSPCSPDREAGNVNRNRTGPLQIAALRAPSVSRRVSKDQTEPTTTSAPEDAPLWEPERSTLRIAILGSHLACRNTEGRKGMNGFSQYVMEAARKRGLHIRLARAARRYGLEVRESSKHPNLVDFINDRKIDVVLDVGANSGQFGQKLRGFGYRGVIVSYEPVSSAFKYLERNAKSDDKWTVNNFAIGAESGQLKINISKNSKFSSILSCRKIEGRAHGVAYNRSLQKFVAAQRSY